VCLIVGDDTCVCCFMKYCPELCRFDLGPISIQAASEILCCTYANIIILSLNFILASHPCRFVQPKYRVILVLTAHRKGILNDHTVFVGLQRFRINTNGLL
jgi:hypothetical protein